MLFHVAATSTGKKGDGGEDADRRKHQAVFDKATTAFGCHIAYESIQVSNGDVVLAKIVEVGATSFTSHSVFISQPHDPPSLGQQQWGQCGTASGRLPAGEMDQRHRYGYP